MRQTPAFLQMPAGIPHNSRDFPTKINPPSIPRTARRSPDRVAMHVAGAMAHVCAETPPFGPDKGTQGGNSPQLGGHREPRDLETESVSSRRRRAPPPPPPLSSPLPLLRHSARFGFTPRYVFALIARSHVPNRDYCCREKTLQPRRSAYRKRSFG